MSDPKLTSTSFTLLVDSRNSDRFLCAINLLLLRRVSQIRLQGPQVLQVTLNGLLDEFFLYVLEDLHTTQGLGALKFTSAEPAFVKETAECVYPLIPATPTAP